MLTLLFVISAALAAACEVTGTYRGLVDVRPTDTSPFAVFVEDSKIAARPARAQSGAIPIEVQGTLRFDGSVKDLDFSWASADPVPGGVVHLVKGASLRIVSAEKVGEGDEAKITYTVAFPRSPITVSGVELPCKGLRLGIASARAMAEADITPKWPGPDDKKRWKLAPGPLNSERAGGIAVGVAATDGYTPVVAKFAEKDGWAHVGVPLGPAAWLIGWVEVSRLSAYDADYLVIRPSGSKTRNSRVKSNEYPGSGLVTIAEGADVYASPGATPWGKLAAGSYLVAPASALDYEDVEMTKKERRQTGKMDWYLVLAVPGYGAEKREWVKHPDSGKSLLRVPNVYINEDGLAANAGK